MGWPEGLGGQYFGDEISPAAAEVIHEWFIKDIGMWKQPHMCSYICVAIPMHVYNKHNCLCQLNYWVAVISNMQSLCFHKQNRCSCWAHPTQILMKGNTFQAIKVIEDPPDKEIRNLNQHKCRTTVWLTHTPLLHNGHNLHLWRASPLIACCKGCNDVEHITAQIAMKCKQGCFIKNNGKNHDLEVRWTTSRECVYILKSVLHHTWGRDKMFEIAELPLSIHGCESKLECGFHICSRVAMLHVE